MSLSHMTLSLNNKDELFISVIYVWLYGLLLNK